MTPDPRDESRERADDERYSEWLEEDRLDLLASHAPAPDFTPRTLGERHAECLRNLDRGLNRAEELAADVERRLARILSGPGDDL